MALLFQPIHLSLTLFLQCIIHFQLVTYKHLDVESVFEFHHCCLISMKRKGCGCAVPFPILFRRKLDPVLYPVYPYSVRTNPSSSRKRMLLLVNRSPARHTLTSSVRGRFLLNKKPMAFCYMYALTCKRSVINSPRKSTKFPSWSNTFSTMSEM